MINEDKSILFISQGQLIGKFAECAIRQSPYVIPDNLEVALKSFATKLDSFFKMDPSAPNFYKVFKDAEYFKKSVEIAMYSTPEIVAWNNRKNGNDGPGFVSAYDTFSDPDNDFVDLSALYCNVIRELYYEYGSSVAAWETPVLPLS